MNNEIQEFHVANNELQELHAENAATKMKEIISRIATFEDFQFVKNNFSALNTAPTTAENKTEGYTAGSVWVSTGTSTDVYICTSSDFSTATWFKVSDWDGITTSDGDANPETVLEADANGYMKLTSFEAAGEILSSGETNIIRALKGTSGGISMESMGDVDAGFDRGVIASNARWDYTGNVWDVDNIGANDAQAVLFKNSGVMGFIIHPSTGATAKTFTHANFVAGAVLNLTSTEAIFRDVLVKVNNSADDVVAQLYAGGSDQGALLLNDADGDIAVFINSNGGGDVRIYNASGSSRSIWNVDASGHGQLSTYNSSGFLSSKVGADGNGGSVTVYSDVSQNSYRARLRVDSADTGRVEARNSTGTLVASLLVSSNHGKMELKNSSASVKASITAGASNAAVIFDLPTSDPAVTGQLWNDSGTVKIS